MKQYNWNVFRSAHVFPTIILWTVLSIPSLVMADQREIKNVVVPDTLVVSSEVTELYGYGWPGNVARVINSGDEIVFFYGSIRVLNPTKRSYTVWAECVDENGKSILSETLQRTLTDETSVHSLHYGRFDVSLGLNPKPGVLVKGQRRKLAFGHEYSFRVYVDGAMVAISSFRYEK